LETRREVLWFGREREAAGREAAGFGSLGDVDVISRTYRIIYSGKPIALICERFPIGADRTPTHE
jgi:chorismate-pyruvate lyase